MNELTGKTVALTGATGGIGRPLCINLLKMGARLILVDRNKSKSLALKQELEGQFPDARILHITADLSSINSVKSATKELLSENITCFIHNAGAYGIPRYLTENGFDNIFHINFVAPYYMIKQLLPQIKQNGGRVVATGSIAHRYGKADFSDYDYRSRKRASLAYGNAKRFLMFSLYKLFESCPEYLSIVHPGITFTGITDHYPKLVFALIKHPMKVIFMKPEKACLSTVKGVLSHTPYSYWWGPRFFDVWGRPVLSKIKTNTDEVNKIFSKAEEIYSEQIK